jgi:hypothetical protein
MPDGTVSKVELRRQLNGISMKKGDDPAVLGTQNASTKVRFNKPGQTIDESEFIAVVIAQAPMIYIGVLTSEQVRHGNHLKLHHLFTAMDMQWHAMGGGEKQEANKEGEIALVAFQGVWCFICNKKGHIGRTNVPTNGRTETEMVITEKPTVKTTKSMVIMAKPTAITEIVTAITEKGFAGQRAVMVLIVDIAVSQTT